MEYSHAFENHWQSSIPPFFPWKKVDILFVFFSFCFYLNFTLCFFKNYTTYKHCHCDSPVPEV